MDLTLDIYQMIRAFLERGSGLLLILTGIIFVMWGLILERLVYLNSEHPAEVRRALSAWQARSDRDSWHSEQIYDALVSRLSIRLQAGIPMIKTLAALCPLLGLLGTVTGMIYIFDAVSIVGSGSARAVADGVSTAIVTTMAGLVGALSGIFPAAMLARLARSRVRLLRAGHDHSSNARMATPLFRMRRTLRYGLAPVGGLLITVTLVVAMEQMIVTGKDALTENTQGYRADYIRVERTEEVAERNRKPDRPQPPEEMPQWIPDAAAENFAAGNVVSVAGPRASLEMEHTIRGFAGFISDGDYLPILKVAPIYPRQAEARGMEGWVLFRFSLTTSGSVTDLEILESSHPIFEQAALVAAAKFKYKPRVINGEPVEVHSVVNRIFFLLSDE